MNSGQTWIEGGEFSMGSDRHYPDEGPARLVEVEGFAIDITTVTNDQFSEFVEASGHVTVAEVAPKAEDFPDASIEDLVPGSLVFQMTEGPVNLGDYRNWWHWTHGADWRHPTGPESDLEGLEDHPVTQVTHEDAAAYATWAGKSLPTEAEWEFASRGGLDSAEFVWGDDDPQDTDQPSANTWQGRFPYENIESDGFTRTSPVGLFAPNGYGLYDMAGNVWEWTNDWYHNPSLRAVEPSCCAPTHPLAPRIEESYDPGLPGSVDPRKVIKGGSHLCTIQYCFRYRPAARQPQTLDTSTCHLGFRCVTRPE